MSSSDKIIISRRGTPPMMLPAQAPPIRRNDWLGDAVHESGDGVQAAQSACSHLTGLSRQMCYATVYGVSV